MTDSRVTISDISEIKGLLMKGLAGDTLKDMHFMPQSGTVSKLLNSVFTAPQGKKTIEFVNCCFENFLLSDLELLNDYKLLFEGCSFSKLVIEGKRPLNVYASKQTTIEKLQAKSNIRAKIEIRDSRIGSILFSMATNKVDEKHGDEKKTYVYDSLEFNNCDLGVKLGSIVFRNVEFKAPLSFNGSTFYVAPKFFSTEIHEDTDFVNARFLDTSSRHAMRAYRALKQRMSGFHAEHEEYLFHRLELESRFKTILPRCCEFWRSSYLEMVGSGFLGLLNRYGQNFWLPVLWLMYMAWAFHSDQVSCGADEIYGWLKDVCDNKRAGLFYTIRNAFGPFGLILSDSAIQPNTLSVKILGFIHLLISSVIWFIWILQIRSRFKL